MKAVGYHTRGDASVLDDVERPKPHPGPHDLLVEVSAVSVNPVDTKVRTNMEPTGNEPRVLGFDAAGVVRAVGVAVTLFRPGDEVYYAGHFDRPGSNAEWQIVDERIVGRKPATLSFAEAAALPLTAITAWELLFDRLRVPREGKGTLLVINGAGGVGSILIQLARKLTGLTVVATASRPDSIAWCQAMGAHHVVDHHQPLHEVVRALGISQVEYVASLTATDKHLPAIVEIIAPQGRMVLIDDPQQLDIVPFKRKSVSVSWEFMFTRSLFHTPDMVAQHTLLNEIAALVDAGEIRTTMKASFGLIEAANMRRAHTLLESGHSIGKVVLEGFAN
ncbi:MAG: zinc-binding alcohol dehydrogenase family protein [Roseomonas sp.]|nr:zinc-binding alcohol dehydrogenase family protein [Roseomonas sp.]